MANLLRRCIVRQLISFFSAILLGLSSVGAHIPENLNLCGKGAPHFFGPYYYHLKQGQGDDILVFHYSSDSPITTVSQSKLTDFFNGLPDHECLDQVKEQISSGLITHDNAAKVLRHFLDQL